MAQRVQVFGPEGPKSYTVYGDNREIAADFAAGELQLGEEILYNSHICELLDEFADEDGCKYMQMLIKGGLGSTIDFKMM